jgi:hypothetical protein
MTWNVSKYGPPREPDKTERKPRLLWLLGFQVFIIPLVVLMARATRHWNGPRLLEDRLGPLSQNAIASHIQEAFGGGREWLAVVVAMVGALLVMPPVVGECRDQDGAKGRSFRRYDDHVAPHRGRGDTGDLTGRYCRDRLGQGRFRAL